jgi:hypothetical protein
LALALPNPDQRQLLKARKNQKKRFHGRSY